ncbi:hypothetical protein LY76DRAFT_648198 [Colletotrichum caudatum]|nr:hypothetical protein LY76DRAFT_648198 [Colletotrichum caudatum]
MQASSYTALSYTWGEQKAVIPFLLTTKNMEARKQGVSLGDSVPLVYERAFEITRQLDVDFIWIDSLCMLQDRDDNGSKDRKDNFDNHVHKIYQNARVTICAIFQEPTMDPLQLRKVPGSTEKAKVANNYYIAKRLGNPAVDIGVAGDQRGPYWAKRGWTFQERVLATSCIFLTDHQLYWECRTALLEEDGMSHLPVTYKRKALRPQDFWPSMIRDYSGRTLSYDSDKIPAVTGIAKELSGEPNNGFLEFGFMPQRFGRDILWESGGGLGAAALKRREVGGKVLSRPPSWSWAYWNGSIDFETYLQDATLSSATYSVRDDVLQIRGAQYAELQAGAKMATSLIAGPTDIVYSVRREREDREKSLLTLKDKGTLDDVGWVSFDVNPNRSGGDADEKKVVSVRVSTTTWTYPGKPDQVQKAANVLILNALKSAPGVYRRVGVGQVWDVNLVDWKQATGPMPVGSFEEARPSL